MQGNGDDPVDASRPNSRLLGHPQAEHTAKITTSLVLEAPNGIGNGTAVFEHGADAVIALGQRVTRTTEEPLFYVDQAVARSTTAWRDEIQQPRENGLHAVSIDQTRPALLVVVGFAAEDGKPPVDLFGED